MLVVADRIPEIFERSNQRDDLVGHPNDWESNAQKGGKYGNKCQFKTVEATSPVEYGEGVDQV